MATGFFAIVSSPVLAQSDTSSTDSSPKNMAELMMQIAKEEEAAKAAYNLEKQQDSTEMNYVTLEGSDGKLLNISDFKQSELKVRDLIDMELTELKRINAYTDRMGQSLKGYVIQSDGTILGKVRKEQVLDVSEEVTEEVAEAIEEQEGYYEEEAQKQQRELQTRPAYYYTAVYHNNRMGDTLRITEIVDLPMPELKKLEVIIGGQSFVNVLQPNNNKIEINEEFINQLGLMTLADLLNCVSAFNVFPNDYVINGNLQGLSGNFSDVRLLLNGHVINSLYSQEAFISHQFGVNNISQVEITLGPGEVDMPYDNYAGSINIITKDYKGTKHNIEIQGELANASSHRGYSMNFGKTTKDFHISGSTRVVKASTELEEIDLFLAKNEAFNHDSLYYANGANRTSPSHIYHNEKESIAMDATANFRDFYAGMNFYSNRVGQKGNNRIAFNYDNANYEKRDMLNAYAGIEKLLTKHMNVSFEYGYTEEKIEGMNQHYLLNESLYNTIADTATSFFSSDLLQNEFTTFYGHTENNSSKKHSGKVRFYANFPSEIKSKFLKGDASILFGYYIDHFNLVGSTQSAYLPLSGEAVMIDEFKHLRHDVFVNVKKSFINERLYLSLGGKYKNHELFGDDYLIRSSASLLIAPKTYIKGSYNQGILEPSAQQFLLINDDATSYSFNDALKSAKSTSWDVGFSSNIIPSMGVAANFFQTDYENHLLFKNNKWYNSVSLQRVMGMNSKLYFNYDSFLFSVNYTYQYQKNNLNFHPHKAVIVANYNAHKFVGINVATTYLSALKTQGLNDELLELPSYMLFDLNITSRAIPIGNTSLTVVGSLRNLLDTEVVYPSVSVGSDSRLMTNTTIGNGRFLSGKLILKL